MTMLFVNLPVADVARSARFWSLLGFAENPQFADDLTTNVVVDDNIVVMLLAHPRFAQVVDGATAQPGSAPAAVFALSADSRSAVDALADRALTAGAVAWKLAQDRGFMYSRSFTDPDGHRWEVMWVDVAAAAAAHRPGADAELAGTTA